MNMNRLSELDPYWIVEQYDSVQTLHQLANRLHEHGVPRDDGLLIAKIIDATVDMRVDGRRVAVENGTVAEQPITALCQNAESSASA